MNNTLVSFGWNNASDGRRQYFILDILAFWWVALVL
jgi:hypothetical protein